MFSIWAIQHIVTGKFFVRSVRAGAVRWQEDLAKATKYRTSGSAQQAFKCSTETDQPVRLVRYQLVEAEYKEVVTKC